MKVIDIKSLEAVGKFTDRVADIMDIMSRCEVGFALRRQRNLGKRSYG